MKIAIIDVDGVIVDSTKRFEMATVGGRIDWEKALSSDMLHLDELLPQAAEHMAVIRSHYDQVIILTSRYDHMREASVAWLKAHGITQYDRAIFKPWDTERFTKTKRWKAQEVGKILREASQSDLWNCLPRSLVAEVLILEDNEDNQQEISQEVARWILSNKQARARYFLSLQEAARKPTDDDDGLGELADIPF